MTNQSIEVIHQKTALRRETAAWQRAALVLFALSLAVNLAQTARIDRLEASRQETEARLAQAEHTRDLAVQQLGALSIQTEQDRQAISEQAITFEPLEGYQYIGECTITAYCPCAECCGEWSDGLTATGLLAGPGIVAIDPDVIPLGSTVLIDGQRYLAADTGVTGTHVDVCAATHQEAEAFGVRTAEVWVVAE